MNFLSSLKTKKCGVLSAPVIHFSDAFTQRLNNGAGDLSTCLDTLGKEYQIIGRKNRGIKNNCKQPKNRYFKP